MFRSTLSIWNNTTVRGFCLQNQAVVVCMRIGIQEKKILAAYNAELRSSAPCPLPSTKKKKKKGGKVK